MRLTACVLATLMCCVAVVRGHLQNPAILLGAIHDGIEFADHYAGGEPITEQHFALTFQTSTLLPNPDPSAWPYSVCIGCDRSFPLGWTRQRISLAEPRTRRS